MLGIDFVNVFVYRNDADNFTAQLLRLYAKADAINKVKLASAYPDASALYEWWATTPNPPTVDEIMKKAGAISQTKAELKR